MVGAAGRDGYDLKRLGFAAKRAGRTSRPPCRWREHDVKKADLVEEIARIRGYANIPAVMLLGFALRPDDASCGAPPAPRRGSRSALSRCFPIPSSQKISRARRASIRRMFHLVNPLTDDEFAVMRTSLPSVALAAARPRDLRLFDVARRARRPSEAMDGPWTGCRTSVLNSGPSSMGRSRRGAKGNPRRFWPSSGSPIPP